MNAWRAFEITVVLAGGLLLLAGGLSSLGPAFGTSGAAQELPLGSRLGLGLPFWAGVALFVMAGSLLLLPRRALRRAA